MTEPTYRSPRLWAFTVAVTIAALSAALGGCGHDDYYCDSTGCFFCDGVGCRPVTPPSRPTCNGEWDCAAGTVCTSAGCATVCHANADCAQGWICRGASADGGTSTGICVAPTEMQPTPNPGSCTTNAQCRSGLVCVNGACTHSTTPACTADTDCPAGNLCLGGRCTPTSSTCQFNSQCGTGRVCVNSECRQGCGTGLAACPAGQQCVTSTVGSYCANQTVPACVHDADCGAGQRCANGTCYQTCTPGNSATCGSTALYCSDDGLCVPDTRPRPFCDDAHPCAGGSSCVGGFCRVPCSTDTQCRMHDISYRNCGPIPYLAGQTASYCLTDDEYRPVCSRQAQCGMSQSCIDGVCR